ncbi:hypothetical protein Taro_016883 [Colocasia esculenta]|uniref:Uncharacterized protein n=1 Tax=Colocasia esculenta TaxID=4460 RepID=A0A843URJ1_COLES|nr:hypothetical protein [Colocasia esculenta]
MYWTPTSPFPVPHSREFRARISRGVRHGPVTVWSADCGLVSLARLRPVRGRRTRIKYVIGLMGLAEAFRHSCD